MNHFPSTIQKKFDTLTGATQFRVLFSQFAETFGVDTERVSGTFRDFGPGLVGFFSFRSDLNVEFRAYCFAIFDSEFNLIQPVEIVPADHSDLLFQTWNRFLSEAEFGDCCEFTFLDLTTSTATTL